MVRLDAVLRAVDIALQLRITQVPQCVDAAHNFVELEDRAPRRVRSGVSAQLADKRTLGHFLEAQRGDDLIHVRFFVGDHREVSLADRADQEFLVPRRFVGAIQFLQLVIEFGYFCLSPKKVKLAKSPLHNRTKIAIFAHM